VLILYYRNFSEELHSLRDCVKSASEIFLHEPIQFSGNIINVLLLKCVFLHLYSTFSEVLHICEKNIQVSFCPYIRVPLKCPPSSKG
jgi:hypothetical protein